MTQPDPKKTVILVVDSNAVANADGAVPALIARP